MRPIKFRAWNGRSMDYNAFYVGCRGNIYRSCEIGDEGHVVLEKLDPSTVIMQFTGLLDRNNKEIYEGDVLNCWDWGQEPQKLLTVSILEWDADDKGWGLNPDPTDGDRYDLFRNVEVISNIYEHPELVK